MKKLYFEWRVGDTTYRKRVDGLWITVFCLMNKIEVFFFKLRRKLRSYRPQRN